MISKVLGILNPTSVPIEKEKVVHKSKYVKTNFTTVVDFDMPFISMVWVYMKNSFAVIPTVIIWILLYNFVIKDTKDWIQEIIKYGW